MAPSKHSLKPIQFLGRTVPTVLNTPGDTPCALVALGAWLVLLSWQLAARSRTAPPRRPCETQHLRLRLVLLTLCLPVPLPLTWVSSSHPQHQANVLLLRNSLQLRAKTDVSTSEVLSLVAAKLLESTSEAVRG
jgi:hypothetical protein